MRANVLFIGALLLGTSVSAQDLDNCAKADVILNTVVANLADCGQTFIASVSATELQPFCSLLFDGLKCAAGKLAPGKEDECFDRMIQLVKNDPSAVFDRIKPLLAAMGENIELRFVNQVGECSIYKTLGNCVNIGVIVQTVVANVADCGQKFIASVSATEFQPFCSLLFDGLECVAGKLAPNNDGLCFKRMAGYVKDDPGALFDQIKPLLASMGQQIDLRFANKVGECNVNKDGDDDDDDSDDKDDNDKYEDWNTACPKIENEGGLCPQSDCTADTDCQQKHTCCRVGGEQCNQCIPDMRQCGDILSIFANDDVKVSCVAQLAMTWRPGNASDYCRFIWKLVDCFSEKIMPGTYQKLCYERMAKLLEESQLDLVRALQKVNNAIKIADIARYLRTDDCEENPLRKQPERPEPNDVKTCFNKTNILNAAGQCGRVTGSSATNVNCKNLNDYIECIAKRLLAGKNDNVVRKCTGEVYEFVKRNQGNLPNSFGNISPQSCQERMSVCGYGLSPLDGAQCKTAKCPATYVCKQGFCCPQVKMGYCPKVERGDRPICKKSCKMDSECEVDEKCCEGCGRKTCMKMETEDDSDKSKCEELLEEGKNQLASRGICGDGTVLTKLPRCQNKRFSPLQMVTETGRGYCVTEDGRKINGSDFTGNRDCTKVREGSCPPTPAECQTVTKIADTCQSNDFKCENGQKCCTFYEGGTCLTKCVAAQKAREPLADDCQDRKCCPLTLCDNKICLKDRTAVCSINSCGKCEAEFYNLKGEKIDCNAGVPLCLRLRAAAREENANRQTTEYEMISFFMKSRDNREMRYEKDDDDDEDGDYDDNDDDEDEDEDNNDDDDDMGKGDEYRRDEYGIERQEEDKLPDDDREDNDDDMEKSHAMMKALKMKLCEVFDNFDLCQNGGTCQIGSGESFWEVCKCPTGFSGLFCETTGAVSPRDTLCNRDRQRISTISAIMMGSEHMKEKMVLQEMFNRLKPPQNIMSTFTCDAAGNYQQIQMGTTLPKTLHSIQIYYCVDTTTGMRIRGTPVTMVDSGVMPDCTITTALPDIMGLPRICMVRNTTRCSNGDECQYFWNQEEGTCEKGKARGGFNRLTDCYDVCSIQKGCTNDPNGDKANTVGFVCQKGVISGPKPCRMEDSNGAEYDTCDYERQFCEVEDTASGHIGMCKTFPRRCLDGPESGYGGRTVGAYYFNTKTRTCNKFLYRGMGGNLNRYYHLKQCHTECSTRMYKFDDAVCPIPKMLEMSMDEVSNCDSDEDCEGVSVCCFNGKGRICTNPVRTCSSGLRCSLFGSCSGDQCVCDDCTDIPLSQVCGTDGQTYPSLCHMRRKSCQVMQNITKAFDGPCKTKCGETEYCEKYEICENNVCKCPEFCTADYNPVCAKGAKSGAMCTYSNECVMNMTACKMKERFVKLKDEECSPDDSSGTCRLQCTREYMPICVYDTTDTTPVQNTYGNGCLLKEAMLNGRKLQVLSPGPCSRKCGTTEQCPFYKACMDGACKCADACTKDYRPICAHPQGNNAKLLTFTNLCLMNQRACSEDKLYIIVKHGPCKEPEPVLACPKTMDDMPFSASVECKTENNEGCDTEMGEVCCSYGAGMKCTAKKELERVNVPKIGICPAISGLNFDEAMCDSYKCMDDSDCAGIDSKCCANSKCGHMTCSVPLVKQEESPCAFGSYMVSECDPSAAVTGCVKGGTCTVALTNPEKVSVCCVPGTQLAKPGVEKEIYEAHFCKLLATAGITCANGGTCIGNIRDGQVCQCKTGFFGPFCRDYVPTNCEIQAACVANPCDVTKCPAVPDATCHVNTCERCSAVFKRGTQNVTHLCHTTPCFVQRAVMKALAESIYKESDTSDDADDMETNPFKHMLMYLMKHIGMPAEPVIYEDLCTATGHFKPEQCIRGMGDSKRCYCVNTQTGMPIPNGPKVTSLEGLNCGALNKGNSGLQEFCFKQPSKKRCRAPSKRYFFNTRTMDCEQFHDYGCDFENGNNFVNYKTCKTACGVMSSALSKCAAARSRCGSGKQCIIVDGNAVCVDPDNVPAKFEPICDADGNFHAKQCHGEICKCVNPTTGDTISNSEAHGQNLTCKKDGNNVKPNRTKQIVCEGNRAAVFCANDGDICNNCELGADRENQRANNDEKVDDQNVCKSCKRCTSSQGKQTCKTENLCVNKCKGFPKAVCRINKCTCREEYFANGKVVNCSALHGNCEKEKHNAMLEEKLQALRNNGNVPENSRQIKCSESHTYLAACRGNKCQCLDPTDGTEVGRVQTGKTLDTIDCTSVQNEKKAKRANLKAVLSKVKNLNQLNQRQQDALKSNVKKRIEEKYAVIVERITLKTGSIVAEIELVECDTTVCLNFGTTDVVSITNAITTEISQGEFSVDADGETFVASEATVEFQTGPTTEPTPMDDDDDDNKTTVIIVVVVVVVVCIVAIAVAFYCYKKANKSSNKDIPFSDIQGKNNPGYERP